MLCTLLRLRAPCRAQICTLLPRTLAHAPTACGPLAEAPPAPLQARRERVYRRRGSGQLWGDGGPLVGAFMACIRSRASRASRV
eukprot:3840359-Prymnesium_polylepis.1